MQNNFYYPVLKWKSAEKDALKNLKPEELLKLSPLLEIQERNYNTKKRTYSKTVIEYCDLTIIDIKNILVQNTTFIDFKNILGTYKLDDNSCACSYILSQLYQSNIDIVPVYNDEFTQTQKDLFKSHFINHNKPIAIRLTISSLDEILNKLYEIENALEIEKKDIILFLDFKYIEKYDLELLSKLKTIIDINLYNKVVSIGTSIPSILNFKPNTLDKISRKEFKLWFEFLRSDNLNNSTIQFGDYTIVNPADIEFDPAKMNASAIIKYSTTDKTWICKGSKLAKGTYIQFLNLAEQIIDLTDFCGKDYSFGDNYIYIQATDSDKPGTPTTWILAGVNHHLTFVINQLSNLSYF